MIRRTRGERRAPSLLLLLLPLACGGQPAPTQEPAPPSPFRGAPGSPFTIGGAPADLAIGDVDGDGALDAAMSSHDSNDVLLLRGWKGRFTPFPAPWIATGSPDPPHNHGLALADLDGDGSLDLLFGNQGGSVAVLLGDGQGGFTPAPGSPVAAGRRPYPLAVGDLDGDGILDLAGSTRANRIQILHGRGDGTFDRGPTLDTGTGAWNLATADLDQDGKPDLASLGAEDGTVFVWLQR